LNLERVFAGIDRSSEILASRIAAGEEALSSRAPAISSWSVAQQIDHTLKVRKRIVDLMLSGPAELGGRMKPVGHLLLFFDWLPRGVGRAPEHTHGKEKPANELATALAHSRDLIDRLRAAPDVLARPERVLPHPRFGSLSAFEGLRFTGLHDRHHLRLIDDILSTVRKAPRAR
jgi:hypothetical protein